MANHSSILAWEILWTEEPGELQSMELQRFGHDWAHTHWSLFLPHPSFWQPLFYSLFLFVCPHPPPLRPFPHICNTMQYLSACLISLSIMPSSSIPVVEDAIFHFLWLGRVPLCVCVCVYLPHLYPVIHWWTLSFISHILAIINNTQWKQRCIYLFKLVYFR